MSSMFIDVISVGLELTGKSRKSQEDAEKSFPTRQCHLSG